MCLCVRNSRAEKPEELEADFKASFQSNVIGYVHLYNLVVPLVLQGRVKKVMHIGTGHVVQDLIRRYHITGYASYTTTKAAMNTVIAKLSAEYAPEGVLFLSVSPGVVMTNEHPNGECLLLTHSSTNLAP
jgi:NAD(P)-dependent dehydrogenase (short-subunit alcohol dehydrogenase family)